ncbi:MAG: polysaccharide biosynthesis/export family protein [Gammaproteobacteria bacterium]
MTIRKKFNLFLIIAIISGCSISPGMHLETQKNWLNEREYVFIDSISQAIEIQPINNFIKANKYNHSYRIGSGDQIAVVVWGLPDIFPIINVSPDQNLRRVDQNGNIFFPYVGLIKASNKTQDELREDITVALSKYFNDPQVDVTISRFNSQQVFVLGEVTKPSKLNLTDIPISLSDALGISLGLNKNTAGPDVFIIRQASNNNLPQIFYVNLDNPSFLIDAGNFYLSDNDIVYVNSSGSTRWNKVISQFFPFASFLNTVDNIEN